MVLFKTSPDHPWMGMFGCCLCSEVPRQTHFTAFVGNSVLDELLVSRKGTVMEMVMTIEPCVWVNSRTPFIGTLEIKRFLHQCLIWSAGKSQDFGADISSLSARWKQVGTWRANKCELTWWHQLSPAVSSQLLLNIGHGRKIWSSNPSQPCQQCQWSPWREQSKLGHDWGSFGWQNLQCHNKAE